MVALGRLDCIFIGIFTQIYLSTSYESGSLSIFQAMTFYETFGLEVAYKIIKRKLGCRVYIFSNLTQVWHDQEAIQYYDQIFMFIIGRTTKMYNLFEKLEEVNFQTGFELIAEEIVDGNVPYLNWASSYIPSYDTANETTAVENMFLPDTNEAFTFRENFINKKYGTLPPNYTIFAGLDVESNSNNSLQRLQRLDLKPYQDLLERIKKGERFPPDATFPGLEMEQDDELRAISEQQQEPIRENLRLIREQKAREARRNFRMRQHGYYERNTPELLEQDMPRYKYYQQNPADYLERNIPRYYQRNPADIERDMPRYYEQKARELYGGDMPTYDERNPPKLYARDMQRYYEQKARELYGPDDNKMYHYNEVPYDEKNYQELTFEYSAQRLDKLGEDEEKVKGMDKLGNAQNWVYKEDKRLRNIKQNTYKNDRRLSQAKMVQTSRSRSLMDVIKSLIYSDPKKNKVQGENEVKVARKGAKARERNCARVVTEVYQPYKVIHEMNGMDEQENLRQPNAINHYIYVQHVDNCQTNNAQGFRNKRKSVRARRSGVKKNERQAPKARQNNRAKAGNGIDNGYIQQEMNRAQEMNHRENIPNCNYKSINTQHNNIAQNNPAGIHRVDQGINNHHAPGALHPQAENNVAHFHKITQANNFNPLSHLHEFSKGQHVPPHQNILQDHQFDKIIHANPMHENMNSLRLHPQQFAEHGYNIRPANMHEHVGIHYNQQHPLHEPQHIRPQNRQKDIAQFHPHNEAIQHINRLPVVHVDHQNIHGYQYQPYPSGPLNNRNNLPVLHKVANKQLYHAIHNAQVMNGQDIPNVGIGMRNPRIQNAAKGRQSRKAKSAPRVRKSRAGRQKAVRARKSKMVTSLHQYNVDTEGNTPVHFIDVLQYHYEPRPNIMMLQ